MLHANMNKYGNAAVIKGDNHLKYAKEIITNSCINFLSRETDNKMTSFVEKLTTSFDKDKRAPRSKKFEKFHKKTRK